MRTSSGTLLALQEAGMFRGSTLVAMLFVAGASIVDVRQAPPGPVENTAPFFAGITDVGSLTRHVDARLAEARALIEHPLFQLVP